MKNDLPNKKLTYRHFCLKIHRLSDETPCVLLHCHRREGDCSECLKETALHRFGLLYRAQIDCQGEDLRSPRRKHHLCRCRPLPLRGSVVLVGFTMTRARICTPMSCSLTEKRLCSWCRLRRRAQIDCGIDQEKTCVLLDENIVIIGAECFLLRGDVFGRVKVLGMDLQLFIRCGPRRAGSMNLALASSTGRALNLHLCLFFLFFYQMLSLTDCVHFGPSLLLPFLDSSCHVSKKTISHYISHKKSFL